jgi:hypothetical protein
VAALIWWIAMFAALCRLIRSWQRSAEDIRSKEIASGVPARSVGCSLRLRVAGNTGSTTGASSRGCGCRPLLLSSVRPVVKAAGKEHWRASSKSRNTPSAELSLCPSRVQWPSMCSRVATRTLSRCRLLWVNANEEEADRLCLRRRQEWGPDDYAAHGVLPMAKGVLRERRRRL